MDKKLKFQRYKRGSIVMIDFSPSIGSETKGKHFGVVLTKKDTPNNAVLTRRFLDFRILLYYNMYTIQSHLAERI